MSYARFDDSFYDQPAALATDLAALGLYALARTYCARHRTDGKIPTAVVTMLARGDAIGAKFSDVLVASGLWVREAVGFVDAQYLKDNLSSKEAEKLTKAAKVRMRSFRKRSETVRANQQRTNAFVPDRTGLDLEASALASEKEGSGEKTKSSAAEFAAWYAAYPRKKKPADARRAWDATRLDRPPLASMLAILAQQRASPEWRKDAGQFVPYPASYLRAGSWADDLGPPSVGERARENLSAIAVIPLAARLNAVGQGATRG